MRHESSVLPTFGSYRTVSVLGRGGMGVVYAAVDEATGARVAIKAFGASMATIDPLEVSRFDREARILCTVDSEHVARVLDLGRRSDDGAPFLVMELLEGQTVKDTIVRYRKLAPALATAIAAQTCRGLARAHAKGIIHRDVKPANLFLAKKPDGSHVVKILDFGIAKFMTTSSQLGDGTLTQTGTLVGSPLYMSPEQAMGLKAIDARTDVWSLGVLLFEAMTGRLPFENIETVGQLIVTICGTPAAPLREVAPWVPQEIAWIVDRALRIRPEERFADARAMLEALLATGADLRITDASIASSAEFGETVRIAQPSAPRLPDASAHALAATMREKPGRAERGLLVVLAATLVIAIVSVTALWLRGRGDSSRAAASASASSSLPPTPTATPEDGVLGRGPRRAARRRLGERGARQTPADSPPSAPRDDEPAWRART
jgi:eukaryotic-like serine/threonine-protein kinase